MEDEEAAARQGGHAPVGAEGLESVCPARKVHGRTVLSDIGTIRSRKVCRYLRGAWSGDRPFGGPVPARHFTHVSRMGFSWHTSKNDGRESYCLCLALAGMAQIAHLWSICGTMALGLDA